jgi:hypothetical protein
LIVFYNEICRHSKSGIALPEFEKFIQISNLFIDEISENKNKFSNPIINLFRELLDEAFNVSIQNNH